MECAVLIFIPETHASVIAIAHSESGQIDYDELMKFLEVDRSPFSGEQRLTTLPHNIHVSKSHIPLKKNLHARFRIVLIGIVSIIKESVVMSSWALG